MQSEFKGNKWIKDPEFQKLVVRVDKALEKIIPKIDKMAKAYFDQATYLMGEEEFDRADLAIKQGKELTAKGAELANLTSKYLEDPTPESAKTLLAAINTLEPSLRG